MADRICTKSGHAATSTEHVPVEDLRNKILFTLMIIAIYRLGALVPAPGVDIEAVQLLRDEANRGGILAFMQLFLGGALTQFAVFALGSCRTSRHRSPRRSGCGHSSHRAAAAAGCRRPAQDHPVDRHHDDDRRRAVDMFAFLFHNGGLVGEIDLLPKFNAWTVFVVVLTLTTGTAASWLGELITQRGIGNGMSLLIFASVVSTLPAQGAAVQVENGNIPLIILILGVALVGIVFVEQGQRRIPVQFASGSSASACTAANRPTSR